MYSGVLFVFLTFFSIGVFGNHGPWSFPVKQRVAFSPHEDATSSVTNALLQRISEGSGRLRVQTSFEIQASLYLWIEKEHPSAGLILAQIRDLSLQGDVAYRDFGLHKVLVPDLLTARLEITDNFGKLHPYNLRVPISENGFLESMPLVDLGKSGSIVGVWMDNISLEYSPEALKRFDSWYTAMKAYYEASQWLQEAGEILSDIHADDPEKLLLEEFRLCEAESKIGRSLAAAYMKWIDPVYGDPLNVLERQDQLVLLADSLRKVFNHAIASIDVLFYIRALDALEAGKSKDEALRLLESALIYNPLHLESNLMIAAIRLETGKIADAIDLVEKVYATIFPLPDQEEAAHKVAERVLMRFLDQADSLNVQGRYPEALTILERSAAFCHKAGSRYPCPDRIEKGFSEAHTGMYKSFLTVARRALSVNNTGKA